MQQHQSLTQINKRLKNTVLFFKKKTMWHSKFTAAKRDSVQAQVIYSHTLSVRLGLQSTFFCKRVSKYICRYLTHNGKCTENAGTGISSCSSLARHISGCSSRDRNKNRWLFLTGTGISCKSMNNAAMQSIGQSDYCKLTLNRYCRKYNNPL